MAQADGPETKLETLEYIFDMLRQLAHLARASNQPDLVYFVEVAALEAGERLEQSRRRA